MRNLLSIFIALTIQYSVTPAPYAHAGSAADDILLKLETTDRYTEADEYLDQLLVVFKNDRNSIAKHLVENDFVCGAKDNTIECNKLICVSRKLFISRWKTISIKMNEYEPVIFFNPRKEKTTTKSRAFVTNYPFRCPSEAELRKREHWFLEKWDGSREIKNGKRK